MTCRWWLAGGMLGMGVAVLSYAVAQQGAAAQLAQANGWYATLEPALAQAQRTGKPLMVVFRCEP